jgi:hypothetical protein
MRANGCADRSAGFGFGPKTAMLILHEAESELRGCCCGA